MATLKALRFSGRLRPITSTWPSRSSVTVSKAKSETVLMGWSELPSTKLCKTP